MGCRWWCAVLVVNEWNIDRPLFLKVGRGREGIGSGKRCQDASSVDDRHHTHTQSRQHSHASCQTARQCCLLGVPLSSQAEETRAPPFGFR